MTTKPITPTACHRRMPPRLLLAGLLACLTAAPGHAAPSPATPPPITELRERLDRTGARLAQVDATYTRLSILLGSSTPITPAALAQAAEEHALRQAALEQLRQALARFQTSPASPQELQTRLQALTAERARLLAAETELLARAELESPTTGLAQEVPLQDMKRTSVMLTGNRVVLMAEPYFKAEAVLVRRNGSLVRAARVSRVRDGQPVDEALAPGGLLHRLLADLDRSKEFLALYVCEDSIPVFRAVAKELEKQKVAYSWDTDDDKPWVMSLGSSSGSAPTARGRVPGG